MHTSHKTNKFIKNIVDPHDFIQKNKKQEIKVKESEGNVGITIR